MTKANGNGFIKLDNDLVHGEVWQSLTPGARSLLIEIWSWHNGRNNGDIRYGVRQAMKSLGCSTRTARRHFSELRDAGLIVVTQKGAFTFRSGQREGRVTAWRISLITEKPGR